MATINKVDQYVDLATIFEKKVVVPQTPSDEKKIAFINELLSEHPTMPIDVAHVLADDALSDTPFLAQSFAAQQANPQLSEFVNSAETPPPFLPSHARPPCGQIHSTRGPGAGASVRSGTSRRR